MKNYFFVIDEKTHDGKYVSRVVTEPNGVNLLTVAKNNGAITMEICATKAQAESIAKARNDGYIRDGVFIFEAVASADTAKGD